MSPVRVRQEALFAAKSFLRRFFFFNGSPKGRGFRYSAGPPLFAQGSPFGRAGAKRLRGQARHERTAHAAISRLFVRAMLSLRPQITVSILALSVTFGDTSPRGRGFVRTGKVCKKLQKPLANFPEMRYNTSRGKSAGNRISASLAQSVRAPDC